MLKCDFHMHAREDRLDWITYPARDLVEKAVRLKFDVLAFTFHGDVFYNPEIVEFARERGILLIPGCEVYVGKKEILCFNITQQEVNRIKTFADLRSWKKEKGDDGLIIAPHPFFPLDQCLLDEFVRNIDLWDAVEYCYMHTWWLNYNRRTERIATERGMPIVGTSDAHELFMFGRNYTMVDAEKNMRAIFAAVRVGKVQRHTPGLSLWRAAKTMAYMDFRHRFAHWFSDRHRQRWLEKRAKKQAVQGTDG